MPAVKKRQFRVQTQCLFFCLIFLEAGRCIYALCWALLRTDVLLHPQVIQEGTHVTGEPVGGAPLGHCFQSLRVTRRSDCRIFLSSEFCFLIFLLRYAPPWNGFLRCAKKILSTSILSEVQSSSSEWLKHSSENRGTPPTVAAATFIVKGFARVVTPCFLCVSQDK